MRRFILGEETFLFSIDNRQTRTFFFSIFFKGFFFFFFFWRNEGELSYQSFLAKKKDFVTHLYIHTLHSVTEYVCCCCCCKIKTLEIKP